MGVIFSTIIALIVAAVVLLIVSRLNLGLTVKGFGAAIIAAIVIAVVAGVITWLLGLLGITIGGGLLGAIILLIVAAVVLMLSDKFVPGMEVKGFTGAIIAAIAIAVVTWIISLAARPPRHRDLSPAGRTAPCVVASGGVEPPPRAASSQNVAFIRDTLIWMETPNAQGARVPWALALCRPHPPAPSPGDGKRTARRGGAWNHASLFSERLRPRRLSGRMKLERLTHPHEGRMTPTTADIRRFLVNTFSDEDLKTLCFDYFRDVYDDFTTGMTKEQMIQLLIERCVRRDALANLEAALRAERPDQYVKQFGARTPPPVPSAIPAEIAPAGRDPRQVFISHAHQDAEFAHRLAADLGSAGWRAWIAPESIQPGEKWVEAIGRGLDGSGVFVVALTPAAVASNWVRNETNAAIELDNRGEAQFIPLDVAACTVPTLWNVYQRVPFRGRYEDGLAALLRRLGTSTERETGRQGDG